MPIADYDDCHVPASTRAVFVRYSVATKAAQDNTIADAFLLETSLRFSTMTTSYLHQVLIELR